MQGPGQETDFRSLLRHELVTRVKRNPGYSARALARDLKISSAFLSQVMSGKRGLSEEKSYSFGERLGWEEEKTHLFATLVRYDNSDDYRVKERILTELEGKQRGKKPKFFDLKMEYFRCISEWHYFAILELTEVRGFVSEPAWIAKRLGIAVADVKSAVERLQRLGFLVSVNGAFKKHEPHYRMPDMPSEAIRKVHGQNIDRAKRALEEPYSITRDITGSIFACDPNKLPEAKELIRKFRWDLMQLLESGEKTTLYQLSVQLFRQDLPDPIKENHS